MTVLHPPWRFVVTDLHSAVLTFLDRVASGRSVTYTLNQPAVSSGTVPSDDPRINIAHTDGDPYMSEANRLLFGFRREAPLADPYNPWVCRFAGTIMQLEDDAASDSPTTAYTAYDAWEYMNHQPLLNGSGALPGQNGLSYSQTRGNVIATQLLSHVITHVGANRTGIDAGVAHGGTTYYGTTGAQIEDTDPLDIVLQQGITVGEAWTQLADTDTIDIVLYPIFDPVHRPGYTHELGIYNAVGHARPGAIFSWDKPGRSLAGISRLTDAQQLANKVQFYTGQGGIPVSVQTAAASVAKYREYWAQQFFPGQNIRAAVELLAQAQLTLRSKGKETLTLEPAPERSPSPFTEYYLGDYVPVYASRNLRKPIG